MKIIGDILLFVILISLFNLIRYMLKIRKVMQMHKDNPNIKGISIINGKVEVIEETVTTHTRHHENEQVIDPICGKEIIKKDAYRIIKDQKEYFFCSWECRENFLQVKTMI